VVLTCFNHLEKYEFVNGKDYPIYDMENKKMFETTNQTILCMIEKTKEIGKIKPHWMNVTWFPVNSRLTLETCPRGKCGTP
jgi:hypothetical protein